ncbi:MAG: glycosyltransferase family 39 protein [Planctomycetes bacterium]|nr:glycosyltransferase family 39 protein [Planctomycetota bacterium]
MRSEDASAWIHAPAAPTATARRGRALALLVLAGFALALTVGVPSGIGSSWRECDTQAIARNFVLDDFDLLRPRVDWRGDTDGAVECEFPLYQALIAAVMEFAGLVEWPGRALSMLFTLLAGWTLYLLLERRSGPAGAIAGLLVFLCSGSAPLLAVRVMPDALSLAAGLVGLLAFVRYLANGRTAALLAAVAAMTVAGLQKPLALQLGLVMFGWTAAMVPQRLRDARLWLGFVAIPAVVAAWLVHAASLHAETGLTFGVVSGGDTKFPDLPHLVDPATYGSMLTATLQYGTPVFGLIALAVLLVRRRLDAADATLLAAIASGLLVSMRYSCSVGLGPHYHAFAAVAGAWLVARAWPERAPRWLWLVLLLGVAVHGAWRARFERGLRIVANDQPLVVAARAIVPLLAADDRLLVRGDLPRQDEEWDRPNNFENPSVHALTGSRGFVVAFDDWSVATIEDRHRRGADIAFDPFPEATPPEVLAWLDDHGERIHDDDGARVHRLRPAAAEGR